MIVLTGDVHHRSLNTRDQRYLRDAEIDTGLRAARLANAAGVPITLFTTGRCAVEHVQTLRALALEGAEIGGHTWDAYSPTLPRRVLKKLTRTSLHGPAGLQRYHVRKTLDHLERVCGARPTSWRNHAYHRDANTLPVLAGEGITACSDEVDRRSLPTRSEAGPWSFPINVIPDHEHLFHAHRDEVSVKRWIAKQRFSDAFGSNSVDVVRYEQLVHEHLDEVLENGGIATLLLHPACMELADDMAMFTRVLDRLRGEKCATMSEAVHALERPLMEVPA